ncbi:hypothetical protein A5727_15910 [Mycobacterium sp. ACS4331]|nr:hypothetical protein A5727_15910 [Mycobacterium sp. ACS4331]
MTSAEDGVQQHREARGHRPDQCRACSRGGHRTAHTHLVDRDMRAHHEHHQRETDRGQQGERRLARIEDAQSGVADDEAGHEFTDDHRQSKTRGGGQQRSGQADRRQQGQVVESEIRHIRRR